MSIPLGAKVRDKITGFEGTVVCKTEWLNKCIRIGVQAHTLKDGLPADIVMIDEPQLEVVEEKAAEIPDKKPTGGPRHEDSIAAGRR